MPIHITFTGDASVAARYVGLGRILLKQAARAQLKSGANVMTLPDATIRTWIAGTQEHIHIDALATEGCELYLESGYAVHGHIGHGQPNASDPSAIRMGDTLPEDHLFGTITTDTTFDNAVVTLPQSVDKTVLYDGLGAVIPQYFESGEHSPRSFFAAKRLTETVPTVDPSDPDNGSGAAGEFPISTLLETKKSLVAKVAPSLFSGKMRLFVQSLYGAPLDIFVDQKLSVIDGQPPVLKMNGVEFGLSDGIFTADDGSYWWIRLNVTLTVRAIELTACGKALAAWLVENPIEDHAARSEYEAYIFASAKLKGISFTLDGVPSVSPVAYGWKYNWSGSEAQCVSLELLGTGNNTYFESSRKKITITRDSAKVLTAEQKLLSPAVQESIRWSISTEEHAAGTFNFDYQLSFLWAPGWSMYQHEKKSGINQFQVDYPGEGEFYGWYGVDDVWVSCTHKHGAHPTEDQSATSHDNFPPAKVIYDGMDLVYTDLALTVTKHNFTIGGTMYESEGGSGTYADGTFTVTADPTTDAPTFYTAEAATQWATSWTVFDSYPYLEPPPYPPTGWTGYGGINSFPANYKTPSYAPYIPSSLSDGAAYIATTDPATIAKIDEILAQNIAWYAEWLTRSPGSYNIQYGFRGYGAAYERNLVSGTITKSGFLAAVIPFFDSEAVYVFQQQVETKVPGTQAYGAGLVGGNHCAFTWIVGAQTLAGIGVALGRMLNWAHESLAPVTSTALTDTGSVDDVRTVVCHKKDAVVLGRADSWLEIFDADVANQVLDQGNYCFTHTSAVYNYVTGSNIDTPSHIDFEYAEGNFIGWF